jgi:hypothetical protein
VQQKWLHQDDTKNWEIHFHETVDVLFAGNVQMVPGTIPLSLPSAHYLAYNLIRVPRASPWVSTKNPKDVYYNKYSLLAGQSIWDEVFIAGRILCTFVIGSM